jgi:hypothetical protein
VALLDLVNELTGTLQGLSPLLAEKHIARAWKDIQRERRWSFLIVDASVVCPLMVTEGLVDITQFDPDVTLDADASAALGVFIGATPDLTQLQIRFGGSSTLTAGQIYRIMAYDNTDPTAIILTLDRPVVEGTNAVSTYQCYRCYITPPNGNFKAWQQIVDMTYGFKLRLNYTSGQFDVVDPQRTSQGDASYCGIFRAAGPYGSADTPDANQSQGAPIYELWPAPTNGRTYYVRYDQAEWALTDPSSTQPATIDDQLILTRALAYYAYPFAQANASNFPAFKLANWPSMILQMQNEYRQLLIKAKMTDDATGMQNVLNRGHGLRSGWPNGIPFPIDAQYIQGHLLNF